MFCRSDRPLHFIAGRVAGKLIAIALGSELDGLELAIGRIKRCRLTVVNETWREEAAYQHCITHASMHAVVKQS